MVSFHIPVKQGKQRIRSSESAESSYIQDLIMVQAKDHQGIAPGHSAVLEITVQCVISVLVFLILT